MVVVPVRSVLGANKYAYNYNSSDEINEWVGGEEWGERERITSCTHLHSCYLYKKQTQAITLLISTYGSISTYSCSPTQKNKERKKDK